MEIFLNVVDNMVGSTANYYRARMRNSKKIKIVPTLLCNIYINIINKRTSENKLFNKYNFNLKLNFFMRT